MATKRFSLILTLLFSLLLSLAACKGDEPPPPQPPKVVVNRPPVASVSAPVKVKLGVEITLDASGSSDEDGDELTFLWLESLDNEANNFLDGVDLTADVITFTPDQEGIFTYTVQVRDPDGETDTTDATFEVDAEYIDPTQYAPVVTGVIISGRFFAVGAATAPTPTAYVSNSETLTFSVLGTDPDSDTGSLVEVFGGAAAGGSFDATTKLSPNDADGFEVFEGTLALEDPDKNKSPAKTVRIQRVPKVQNGLPHAVHVDCQNGNDADDGSMGAPKKTIQAGYEAALADGSPTPPDVYVATGLCEQTVHVGFDDIALYGLFDASDNWLRRSEPEDYGPTQDGGKFHFPTTISSPSARALLYTDVASAGSLGVKVDGLRFLLSGDNHYGISLTTPSTYTRIDVTNNEFTGVATDSTVRSLVGGGLNITAVEADKPIVIARNLFTVNAADGGSVYQTAVFPASPGQYFAGTPLFYSNVVSAPIGYSTPYSCYALGSGSGNPFSVCLHQRYVFSAYSRAAKAHRNLFWVTAVTATASVRPVVLDSGVGRLSAKGNVFYPSGDSKDLKLIHVVDDGYGTNGPDGEFHYSAFPEPAANLVFVHETNTSYIYPVWYTCLAPASNPTGFGQGACETDLNPGVIESTGSITLDSAGLQRDGWRVVDPAASNRIPLNTFTNESQYDFYGVAGPLTEPDFDIGPFEN